METLPQQEFWRSIPKGKDYLPLLPAHTIKADQEPESTGINGDWVCVSIVLLLFALVIWATPTRE